MPGREQKAERRHGVLCKTHEPRTVTMIFSYARKLRSVNLFTPNLAKYDNQRFCHPLRQPRQREIIAAASDHGSVYGTFSMHGRSLPVRRRHERRSLASCPIWASSDQLPGARKNKKKHLPAPTLVISSCELNMMLIVMACICMVMKERRQDANISISNQRHR